jgi:hypothetical protein
VLSFHDLSMGETAALSLSKGMRRGQNSLVDKSSEKTSPGASERKKSFPVPNENSKLLFTPCVQHAAHRGSAACLSHD